MGNEQSKPLPSLPKQRIVSENLTAAQAEDAAAGDQQPSSGGVNAANTNAANAERVRVASTKPVPASEYYEAKQRKDAGQATESDEVTLSHAVSRGVDDAGMLARARATLHTRGRGSDSEGRRQQLDVATATTPADEGGSQAAPPEVGESRPSVMLCTPSDEASSAPAFAAHSGGAGAHPTFYKRCHCQFCEHSFF